MIVFKWLPIKILSNKEQFLPSHVTFKQFNKKKKKNLRQEKKKSEIFTFVTKINFEKMWKFRSKST